MNEKHEKINNLTRNKWETVENKQVLDAPHKYTY